MASEKGRRVRKYATVEGDIVDEGDERARFLVAGINDGIDQDLVDRIKAAYPNSPEAQAKRDAGEDVDDADADTKAADKAEDKQAAKAANK